VCGLFGFTGKAKNYGKLMRYMRVLAMETSERGTHATGFAALLDSGEFLGAKAPLPASKFVFEDNFEAAFNSEPRLFIGHCRLATHGDQSQNKNNHPHISKDRMLAIVHNGIVFQHEKLATSIGAALHGECDSEVILRMVEAAIPPGEKHGYDKLVNVAQELENFDAMFSVLTLDKARRCVWSFRNYSNPLVYWESEEFGVTVFASDLAHIVNAASIIIGKRKAKAITDKALSPEPGYVFRFSDTGKVTNSRARAVCMPLSTKYSRASSGYYGGTGGDWGSIAKANDKGKEDKVVPSSWNTANSQIAQADLPHTLTCECMPCAIERTEDHDVQCDCVECDRILRAVERWEDEHDATCVCAQCAQRELREILETEGG
jgi:asparagine synthetase B (glutamine-hydrolysing)